jgi:hypothetical protein
MGVQMHPYANPKEVARNLARGNAKRAKNARKVQEKVESRKEGKDRSDGKWRQEDYNTDAKMRGNSSPSCSLLRSADTSSACSLCGSDGGSTVGKDGGKGGGKDGGMTRQKSSSGKPAAKSGPKDRGKGKKRGRS